MGISLAFGVLYATTVSLLIVPAHYMILEDLKSRLQPGRAPRTLAPDVSPAEADLEHDATGWPARS
jgi:hypothetical protein